MGCASSSSATAIPLTGTVGGRASKYTDNGASSPGVTTIKSVMSRALAPLQSGATDEGLGSGGDGGADVDKYRVIVVGFGVAAGYFCAELSNLGLGPYEVAVIGDEPVVAYERPTLSKGYLFSPNYPNSPPSRLPAFHTCKGEGKEVHDAEWYEGKQWTAYRSTRVVDVDFKNKLVRTKGVSGDDVMRYEKLIVATGTRERYLDVPGKNLRGIYYLKKEEHANSMVKRLEKIFGVKALDPAMATKAGGPGAGKIRASNQSDGLAGLGKDNGGSTVAASLVKNAKSGTIRGSAAMSDMDHDLSNKTSVTIIGGGYLATELMTAMYGWGFDEINVVVRDERLMAQMTWPKFLGENLEASLVERMAPKLKMYAMRTVKSFEPISEDSNMVGKVILSDGTELDSDFVIVAIGSIPNGDELFKGKLDMNKDGTIVVDKALRTSHKSRDVWAIGECAAHDCGVDYARKMGQYAARCVHGALMMEPELEPFDQVPYHYSRLFDFDQPIVWHHYNYQTNTKGLKVYALGKNNMAGKGFGAYWINEGTKKVVSAMFCSNGADLDIFKVLKQAVVEEVEERVLADQMKAKGLTEE